MKRTMIYFVVPTSTGVERHVSVLRSSYCYLGWPGCRNSHFDDGTLQSTHCPSKGLSNGSILGGYGRRVPRENNDKPPYIMGCKHGRIALIYGGSISGTIAISAYVIVAAISVCGLEWHNKVIRRRIEQTFHSR